ncbi:MAG: diaminopimelate decarboxylase [Firmicutes bacterium]|nr:diaminopimelate decarboxylase [Bacillota bacterium]
MISSNITIGKNGHLYFGGQDTVHLAQQYSTPLYVMDEERIRENMRTYIRAFADHFGPEAIPCYASKANCFKRIYEIAHEEGMDIDVVSSGEIYTAYKANYPLAHAWFHSNNKTEEDIRFAMYHGVGHFVADSVEELDAIEAIAAQMGIVQKILLRLTPGIDPHTYEAVNTGRVDSKFGIAIETGQAWQAVRHALSLPHIFLDGFHCHVGSMVFGEDVYLRASEIMLDFVAKCRAAFGCALQFLDLGGGYGVRYVESDGRVDIYSAVGELAKHMKAYCAKIDTPLPIVTMEPGRSIVADAGMTLYTVGSVKKIPGYKNYTSIDGGMTDNPRYALYRSRYSVYHANRPSAQADFVSDLVGRCCESDDIIQPHISLPEPKRGDIIAVATTGAYNYSMASNYNRIPRPAMVLVTPERCCLAVRRETLEDLLSNDL